MNKRVGVSNHGWTRINTDSLNRRPRRKRSGAENKQSFFSKKSVGLRWTSLDLAGLGLTGSPATFEFNFALFIHSSFKIYSPGGRGWFRRLEKPGEGLR